MLRKPRFVRGFFLLSGMEGPLLWNLLKNRKNTIEQDKAEIRLECRRKPRKGPEKALRPLWQCGKGYWGGAEVRCLYGIHIEEGIYETLFEDAGGICPLYGVVGQSCAG